MVEPDYLDRSNIEVMTGSIKSINLGKKVIRVKGETKEIPFDKILLAYGSFKQKLG